MSRHRHSFLIFVVITGIGWAFVCVSMNTESKWVQAVGNILSEWVQMAGLVFLTKRLIEMGSKEAAANIGRVSPGLAENCRILVRI